MGPEPRRHFGLCFLSEPLDYHKETAAGPALNNSLAKRCGESALNHQIEFYAQGYFKASLSGEAEAF